VGPFIVVPFVIVHIYQCYFLCPSFVVIKWNVMLASKLKSLIWIELVDMNETIICKWGNLLWKVTPLQGTWQKLLNFQENFGLTLVVFLVKIDIDVLELLNVHI
jgi:hypothetical protein